MDGKDYALVDQFGGTGHHATVVGPLTFKEADDWLRKGAAICGDYSPNRGYRNLPCWYVEDDYFWYMVKLEGDFQWYLDHLTAELDG